MRLALFEPDIAANTGTLIRTGACLSVPLDIIEPCGFPASDRAPRRAALDYAALADVTLHASWAAFLAAHGAARAGSRLVLLTTRGRQGLPTFAFRASDTLVLGRESAGVPEAVAARADIGLRIPLAEGARSLNVAVAAAMALGAALAQGALGPIEINSRR